ncbi:hypothetical protein SAMN05444166_4801 [Singulisphaera sp. GP187]|nr:hypothetical protein SAMN05444166_4801 [Singulisphaera sp. GP187]
MITPNVARSRSAGFLAIIVGLTTLSVGPTATAQVASKLPTPAELLDKMIRDFTPRVPSDVDKSLKEQLEAQKKFAEVQLQFDILSWETFVALCWPTDKASKPLPKISDAGDPAFDHYFTDTDVFPADPNDQAPKPTKPRQNRRLINVLKLAGIDPGDRVLTLISSTGGELRHPEFSQAFKWPIWDQNGFMVRYEILVNDEERNYVWNNGLETLNGQVKFSQAGKVVDFPIGSFGKSPIGAMEVKLAWKVLADSDDASRFLLANAKILGADGKPKTVKAGLVGMHIAHKTETSPQWIWSTFSHVDSLRANALATNPKNGKPLTPLFTNPGNETAPVNVPSATSNFKDGLPPTQVLQLTPIPQATEEVNRKAQSALHAANSVLQYFELLNTQWPTDPKAKPTPGGPGTAPGSITNKSGGNPTPVYLVNPLFETYFQQGNQSASGQEEGNPSDNQRVFGTESCMGCHSSAAVAVAKWKKQTFFGPQLTGDFSWLLQTKAH